MTGARWLSRTRSLVNSKDCMIAMSSLASLAVLPKMFPKALLPAPPPIEVILPSSAPRETEDWGSCEAGLISAWARYQEVIRNLVNKKVTRKAASENCQMRVRHGLSR